MQAWSVWASLAQQFWRLRRGSGTATSAGTAKEVFKVVEIPVGDARFLDAISVIADPVQDTSALSAPIWAARWRRRQRDYHPPLSLKRVRHGYGSGLL